MVPPNELVRHCHLLALTLELSRLGAILGWCIITSTTVCILNQAGWDAIFAKCD